MTPGGTDLQAVQTEVAAGPVPYEDPAAEPESLPGAAVDALPAADAGIGGDDESYGRVQGSHDKRFSLKKLPGIVPDRLLTLPYLYIAFQGAISDRQ